MKIVSSLLFFCLLRFCHGQYRSCRVPAVCTETVDGKDRLVTVWKSIDDCSCGATFPSFPHVWNITDRPSVEIPIEPTPISVSIANLSDRQKNEELMRYIKKLLEPGWINGPNGYQYWLSQRGARVSFATAELLCKVKGGHIAYVGMMNSESRKFIAENIITKCTSGPYQWIGLNIKVSKKKRLFVWSDGTLANGNNTNWARFHPRRHSYPTCVAVSKDGTFYDSSCDSTEGVLCERYMGV